MYPLWCWFGYFHLSAIHLVFQPLISLRIDTKVINDHIIVDLDESGHVVGIEINGVSLANINPYLMTVEYDTDHADEQPNTVVETG